MTSSIVHPEAPIASPIDASARTRPFAWSVRRELWENRYLWIAPLIVAAVVLFASLIVTLGVPRKVRSLPTLEPAQQAAVHYPFEFAPAPIMFACLLVGIFYCLDALYGERRDRSILFWKSLPISDRTTVLSKVAIPMLVMPLIAWALSVVVQLILFFASMAVLLVSGTSPAPVWHELRFFEGLLIMVYGLSVHALWFAPIYGWLLLTSAWVRRSPILWAVLPLLLISGFERMVTGNTFMKMLQRRFTGAMRVAFAPGTDGDIDRLSQLTPLTFLTTPGLWIGLLFAALCLAAAVRLRRNREPI